MTFFARNRAKIEAQKLVVGIRLVFDDTVARNTGTLQKRRIAVMKVDCIIRILSFGTALVLSLDKHRADAFSTSAGSCNAGVPLQGAHILNEQLGGGPLSDNGFEVRLNGSTLDSESENDVPLSGVDSAHDLTLVAAADGTFFRGFLIRIEGEDIDTREYLEVPEGDDNMIVASLCILVEDVGGVSHTNNNEKTEATALLRLTETATNLVMDVTMVVQNRDGAAEWYNSRYILNAGAATSMPSVSKVPSPAPSISPMPTISPQPILPEPNGVNGESFIPTVVMDTTLPSESSMEEPTSRGNSCVLSGTVLSLMFVGWPCCGYDPDLASDCTKISCYNVNH